MKTTLCNRKPFDFWTRYEDASFTRRLAYFCAQRSGRFEETLCNLVSSNDFAALCNFNIDYRWDDNARDLAYARQTLAFYSKDADLDAGFDKKRAFWISFVETELQCRSTNRRLSSLFHSGGMAASDSIFFDVSRKISEILGEAPKLEDLDIGFGPGTNVGLTTTTNARSKLDAIPTCSSSMLPLINEVLSDIPHYAALHQGCGSVVPGKLRSVAKNAKTERSIIIEAILNGLYQKGIGSWIKDRLLMFGCNLRRQDLNQKLALEGSVTNKIATLDSRNASNTVALLLVFHLIQSEAWFNLLDQTRTSQVEYEGRLIDLEMFSSMGNGFTFELESLIFYATAIVIAERCSADLSKVSVYGDDIICPVECADELIKTLELFGFSLNREKSFLEGPFRESCGSDYFLGINIRPFYKKDRWTNARVVGLLNRDLAGQELFSDIRHELELCLLPQYSFGPQGLGDGHIHKCSWDPDLHAHSIISRRTVKQRFKSGDDDGVYFSSIVKIPDISEEEQKIGDRLFPLYDIYAKPSLRLIENQRELVTVYNVYGVASQKFIMNPKFYSDPLNESNCREADPYVVRGGWKSKKVKIYTLPGEYPKC